MSLARLKQLTEVQQRRAASLLGAIIADAAVTPLHWIYDQDKVAGLVAGGAAEFSSTSYCPFYTVLAGEPSAYGVQLQLTAEGLFQDKGFDKSKMADRFFKHFGPGSSFEATRQQTGNPKQGCWTNHNIKTFIAKREEKEEDQTDTNSKDPDGLVKVIAIVAMYHGKKEMEDMVKNCVLVTQSNPVAVRYAVGGTRILDGIISTGQAPLQSVADDLEKSDDSTDKDVAASIKKGMADSSSHPAAVKTFGLACGMPPSFIGMIHGVNSSTSYTEAVRNEILAGGDNCSRVGFIASCVGAKYGLDSIPEDWLQKVNRIDEILKWVEFIATF